jgi:hypothetical protein
MRPPNSHNDLRNLFPDLEWSTALKRHLRYTATMSQQYNTPITTKRVIVIKHINIKYYVVKEKIQNHTISLEHISTKRMLVDPFIKCLSPNVFKEHLDDMDLRERL